VNGIRSGLAALAAITVAGIAIPTDAEPKPPSNPSLAATDSVLLQDEAKAIAELQHRLRNQVSYRNGVLVIVDRSGDTAGVTVMPATIEWGVDCDDTGIAVTFGTGSGDTDNGIVLQLTSAAVSDSQCLKIAPAVGETVLAITKGN